MYIYTHTHVVCQNIYFYGTELILWIFYLLQIWGSWILVENVSSASSLSSCVVFSLYYGSCIWLNSFWTVWKPLSVWNYQCDISALSCHSTLFGEDSCKGKVLLKLSSVLQMFETLAECEYWQVVVQSY